MENHLLVIFVSVMAGQLVRGSDPQPPACPLGKTFKAPVINDCTSYWNCDNGETVKEKCPSHWYSGQEKFDSVKLECMADYTFHRARCYKDPPPTIVSVKTGQLVRGSDPQPPACPLGKTFKAPVINDCTSYWNCDNGETVKEKCPSHWYSGQEKFDSVKLECMIEFLFRKARCYKDPPPTKPTTDPPKTPSPPTKPSSNTSPSPSSTSNSSPSSSTTPPTTTPPSSTPPTAGPTKPGGASSIAPFGWLLMAILVAAPTFVTR